MMARPSEEWENPAELSEFYVRTAEFPAGFMTEYAPSMLIGEPEHQDLATGFPIGKRFRSAMADRVADGNPVHLGHHAKADGRWRIYAFADAAAGQDSHLTSWADWVSSSSDSPVQTYTAAGTDSDSLFDVKVVYPTTFDEVDIMAVPKLFLPRVGPFELIDYEKVYARNPDEDIFALREIARETGAVVVVRPDQYVATILPLDDPNTLAEFFAPIMIAGA